jgi:hypothetical protein
MELESKCICGALIPIAAGDLLGMLVGKNKQQIWLGQHVLERPVFLKFVQIRLNAEARCLR